MIGRLVGQLNKKCARYRMVGVMGNKNTQEIEEENDRERRKEKKINMKKKKKEKRNIPDWEQRML